MSMQTMPYASQKAWKMRNYRPPQRIHVDVQSLSGDCLARHSKGSSKLTEVRQKMLSVIFKRFYRKLASNKKVSILNCKDSPCFSSAVLKVSFGKASTSQSAQIRFSWRTRQQRWLDAILLTILIHASS